jgi:site-specific DNA-methyltransferase (adenine-specific)
VTRRETGPGWELRLGDYREVLADVEPDAVITDTPYSDRTQRGQRGNARRGEAGGRAWVGGGSSSIGYGHFDQADCVELVERFAAAPWIVSFGDHYTVRWLEDAARAGDRYVFAPVPWCKPDAAPRMVKDGPPTAAEFIHLSRTRDRRAVDVITEQPPGYYVLGTSAWRAQQVVTGGKPLPLMSALVCSYSRPGDLIVDPCAGGATTLLAAVSNGRRAIGAEIDPDTFDLAVARLRRGFTRAIPGLEAS